MEVSSEQLMVVDRHTDRRNRSYGAGISLLTIVIAAVIATRSSVTAVALGMAPMTAHDGIALLLLLVVVGGGNLVAWRMNLFARALAIFRVRELGREGVIAGQALAAGRLDEARVRYAKLLHWAQPLAAYHASFVGLWGVLRFLEGDIAEGLELVERVNASGWLSHPRMKTIGSLRGSPESPSFTGTVRGAPCDGVRRWQRPKESSAQAVFVINTDRMDLCECK